MSIGLDFSASLEAENSPIDPPWTKKNNKQLLEWFSSSLPILEELSEYRIRNHVNNLLWYTGEYEKTSEYKLVVPGKTEQAISRKILPKIFNHLFDITEQRVSRLSALKPFFEVVPTNREENDRVLARLYDYCLKAMGRRVLIDFMMQEVERWNAVFGEVLVAIEWNPNIGDKKSRNSIARIGDVDVYVKEPWTWLPEPKRKRSEVQWGIDICEIIHIEEARKKYNDNKLQPDNKKNIFSFNQDIQEKREEEVVVYKIIEKPCLYQEEGRITYIITDKVVDSITKYPYSHFDFPFEWHTDIDVPGRLFPMSFYQHLKPIQNIHNRLTSIITRNILLTAHPHVLMPKGAAKLEAFANAPTAIEYNGPTPPQILTFSSVPNEVFNFRNEVKEEMGQVGGIQGVSRGAPPSGVRAASMLRFFEEQEQQRASTQIIKHNELIRRIYLKAASVMGDYYPTSSKDRLIRVVGKDNQYLIESFTGAKVSSEYDVIIRNSTGFSESKAGRIEEIGFLQQMTPGLLSPEQISDILELGNVQKAYDITTTALKQAEEENEKFMDNKPVRPPVKYQDLIVHWRTHMILLNSSSFENYLSDEAKQQMFDHVMATEMLMEEKSKENPAFSQQLLTLPGYPAFYTLTPIVPGVSQLPPQESPEAPLPQAPQEDLGVMPEQEMSVV